MKENSHDYIVCVASKEYWKIALSENDYKALNELGLNTCIQAYSEVGNSYVALIDGGTVEHEEISNRSISYNYKLNGDNKIEIVSEGAPTGNLAEIYVNDTQVSMGGYGLNIVVIDKATNKIVDSCYIDTNIEGEHKLTHNGNGYDYMFNLVYNED